MRRLRRVTITGKLLHGCPEEPKIDRALVQGEPAESVGSNRKGFEGHLVHGGGRREGQVKGLLLEVHQANRLPVRIRGERVADVGELHLQLGQFRLRVRGTRGAAGEAEEGKGKREESYDDEVTHDRFLLVGGSRRLRTFNLSVKSRLLCQLSYGSRKTLVPRERFELPTFPIGADCSILLSYRGRGRFFFGEGWRVRGRSSP